MSDYKQGTNVVAIDSNCILSLLAFNLAQWRVKVREIIVSCSREVTHTHDDGERRRSRVLSKELGRDRVL